MSAPSDSAIAQAFWHEYREKSPDGWISDVRVLDRAREIDALNEPSGNSGQLAQPAATGELPEATGEVRFGAGGAGFMLRPVQAGEKLYTVDQMHAYGKARASAAMAECRHTIKTEIGELPCSLAVAAEFQKLEEALAECRRDVERYRWLRDGYDPSIHDDDGSSMLELSGDRMDAAIDAAMQEAGR